MLINQIMKFCHQTKGLGISFKMIKIRLHLIGKHLIQPLSPIRKRRKILQKPVPDRLLPEMSEGRVADIMDQTRALQYVGNVFFHPRRKPGIFLIFQYIFTDILAQRFSQG